MLAWIWAAVVLPATSVAVPRDGYVTVQCPAGAVTRVLFPEPLRALQLSSDVRAAMGVSVERAKPTTALLLRPARHPARGELEFRGPRLVVRVRMETAALGADREVRVEPARAAALEHDGASSLQRDQSAPGASELQPAPEPGLPLAEAAESVVPPRPAPAPLPSATPTPVPPPSAQPSPEPTVDPSTVAFELADLLRATPVPIERREGLPGQLPLVLVDALKSDRFVWLRFTLEGGALRRVTSIAWEQGAVTTFQQEPVGRDLRVVVQLPREYVGKRTRVRLELDDHSAYRVVLGGSTLARILKGLFE